MTIAADIKRVTAELRERDPRWFVAKRLILMRPITHWMHGVYLRSSGWAKGNFYLHPVATMLARPARKHSLPMEGWNVSVPDGHDSSSWNLAWPKCGEVLADVVLNKLSQALGIPLHDRKTNGLQFRPGRASRGGPRVGPRHCRSRNPRMGG